MKFLPATLEDCPFLAALNHQLIRDEGHGNPMSVPELDQRMAASIAGTALAGAAAGKGITLTLIMTMPMTMTKLKFGIAAGVAVACLATSLVQHRSRVKLLAENQTLQRQAKAARLGTRESRVLDS